MGPKGKDVSGCSLKREVLVKRPDNRIIRIQHHLIIEHVGNRSPVRQRHEIGSASGVHLPVDEIQVQIGATPPSSCRVAFREHFNERFKFGFAQISVRVGIDEQLKQLFQVPACWFCSIL